MELERISCGLDRRPLYRLVKRAFDVCFSLAVVAVLLVPCLVVALVIWLDDPHGSPLFFQERVGLRGRRFRMVKFRSMHVDAEERLPELLGANEKDGPVFKIADDPRITRVGRFIRKTSLDELPQFLNVLVGQMSVVGPRPALPREVRQYSPHDQLRLSVKPGITCYWQTRRNRDSISFDEWVDLDLLYILKAGLWTDVKLIIQTVGCVLTFQGE
nr:sugar transferase [Olsenella profusa]